MPNPLFARKPLAMLVEEARGEQRLRRVLGPWTLTALGVGAIVGTGIFILTGVAAHDKTGPALILSFMVAGLACVLAALCYAEFASMAPVAGSAYTYAYATLGELLAWIIGWDLVLEYTVAAAAVAHGWSAHFRDLLHSFGVNIPAALGNAPFDFDPGGARFVATGAVLDLPAIAIVAVLTCVLVRGIRESARFNAVMVAVKLAIILFVIGVGAFYVDPANWRPFAPFGYSGIAVFGKTLFGQAGPDGAPVGVLAGAAIMFFAYLGFDAVSTQAEETRRPQRDVPLAIIASLLVCTVLYIAVAAVLTGMVPSSQIDIDAPVAGAFAQRGLPWARRLIDVGALTGITSVLLVQLLAQPRILMAMGRDGLIPPRLFAAVHARYGTPWKGTIVTACVVATLASLLPLRLLAELTNIGTLFAFVIVCGAVLVMRRIDPHAPRPFRVPLVPFVPILGILICLLLMLALPAENWLRLIIWLAVGLAIYFGYGRQRSVLARMRAENTAGR
jgi:APA family basic amino acid/polyamine antiporter